MLLPLMLLRHTDLTNLFLLLLLLEIGLQNSRTLHDSGITSNKIPDSASTGAHLSRTNTSSN
eukprot:2748627-Ditylum_brightwellii.AAC.1